MMNVQQKYLQFRTKYHIKIYRQEIDIKYTF